MRGAPSSAFTTALSTMSSSAGEDCRMAAATSRMLLAQDLGRLQRGLAADAGAARRPGAAAIGRVVGIAENDADAVHRNAEHAADDLRGERFRALPLLGDAGLADHRALGVQPHRDAVLRRDPGAADAVERGTRIGDLDEARDADAAMDVSCRRKAACSARSAS